MSNIDDLRKVRLEKLQKIKDAGINPYPAISKRTHTILNLEKEFDSLCDTDTQVTLVGRVMSFRSQGGLIFFNFTDGTAMFQGLFKKELAEKEFNFFESVVDTGDFVEVSGTIMKTKTGQHTLLVSSWNMLTKSLLPLPEKWHGLQDQEERFRKRYLDILGNNDIKEMFERKANFWNAIRNYLLEKGFVEVETPTLELTTGGAEANPFKTHHKDFDIDVFMRISVGELWQKRLMAAGFPKTFEIGRVYRNEGSSPEHTQEFTNLEFYTSYTDYTEGMKLVEDMMKKVVMGVYGKTKFSARGFEFDLADEWVKLDYVETIEQKTGINVLTATEAEMKNKLRELKVQFVGENRERLTDALWKYCRKQVAGPAWLINHPKLVSPLSKAKTDNPELTERVQLILAGAEAGNGFSELNDPVDQRARFELQQKLIEAGDDEAMMPEWEFVEMLEHGMPPTFGYGSGERLFSFFEDKPIREVQLFPLMKPKDDHGNGQGGAEKLSNKDKKNKESKVAIIVLNKEANMLPWQKMNTVAHLTAAFGARSTEKLFVQDSAETADNKKINLNIGHAILIKEVATSKVLKEMLQKAYQQKVSEKVGGEKIQIAEFTREMLETTNDKKVIEQTKLKNFTDVEHLGFLVFGTKSIVTEITEGAELAG